MGGGGGYGVVLDNKERHWTCPCEMTLSLSIRVDLDLIIKDDFVLMTQKFQGVGCSCRQHGPDTAEP